MQENTPICCSGGAVGADLAWGYAAEAAGHDVMHFIFQGHKSTASKEQLYVLNREQLAEAEPHLTNANKTVKRRWPVNNQFVGNLLRRNYFQVRYSDSLYAVTHFDNYGMVDGGTAWAVQMMIDLHPNARIYLFDQKVGSWFQWKGAWMPAMQPSTPTGIYAAVGSRALSPKGLAAIKSVFE